MATRGIGASNPGWDDYGCAMTTTAVTRVEVGDGADTSLGLRLNKLHDVHLSYPLPLMRQQLLKWLIRREDVAPPSLSGSSESALGLVVADEDVARLTGALRLITVAGKYKDKRIASLDAYK